ncbi:TetR/AcrR family transcriptional regulator [Clostridium sp. CF011]|uniref:TetR/AcrR family transcriptional regulator n=1 Tax=unclassified Clostridium TaxID=2614128 RepID=UPI001C0CAD46|nr:MULTISPECIES: TetR/AcrR family transcriptional regulator [unclassified Clostridium]MBU3091055.1 TetR/AcrR family transcriptional regulator [Clostridium sp. CF011]MBW9144964.1 TetR/AcrR family transcriptional regulator [Clostridium sp. CM027]UVE40102.1 TetR/AcrR family transcriptional regulator [Clostridium sp. CM027]WAG69027.1 TetR/AcrR family transcriptional regulator [Clostridium sp. CF011]
MPKVSEEYIEERRKFIMQCASNIYEEKPLYKITMRDIIKETGFSQGNVYRYFKSVLEIFIALANQKQQPFYNRSMILEIINAEESAKEKIYSLFELIGAYIDHVLEEIGPKMYYELSNQANADLSLWQEIGNKLYFKEVMNDMIQQSVAYVSSEIDSGRMLPEEDLYNIIQYIGIVIDGIVNHVALQKMNHLNEINVKMMIKILADSVIQMLNIKD